MTVSMQPEEEVLLHDVEVEEEGEANEKPLFKFIPPSIQCGVKFTPPKCESGPGFEVKRFSKVLYDKNGDSPLKMPKLPVFDESPNGEPQHQTMESQKGDACCDQKLDLDVDEEIQLSQWYAPSEEVFGQSTTEQREQVVAKLGKTDETVVAVAAGMAQRVEAAHTESSIQLEDVCRSMLRRDETIVDTVSAVALLNVPGSSFHKSANRFGTAECAVTSEGRLLLVSVQNSSDVRVDGSYKTCREPAKSVMEDGSSRSVKMTSTAMKATELYAKSLNPNQLIDVDFSQVNQTALRASEEIQVDGVKPPPVKFKPKKIKFTCRCLPKVSCCKLSCCKLSCCTAKCCRVQLNCSKILSKLLCCRLQVETEEGKKQKKGIKTVQDSGSVSGAFNEKQAISDIEKLVKIIDEDDMKQTMANVLTVRFLDANTQEAKELAIVLDPSVDMRQALKVTGVLSANCDASALMAKAGWKSISSPYSQLQLGATFEKKSSLLNFKSPVKAFKPPSPKNLKKVAKALSPKKLMKKAKKAGKK